MASTKKQVLPDRTTDNQRNILILRCGYLFFHQPLSLRWVRILLCLPNTGCADSSSMSAVPLRLTVLHACCSISCIFAFSGTHGDAGLFAARQSAIISLNISWKRLHPGQKSQRAFRTCLRLGVPPHASPVVHTRPTWWQTGINRFCLMYS